MSEEKYNFLENALRRYNVKTVGQGFFPKTANIRKRPKLKTTNNHDLTICLVDDDPSLLKATGRLLSSAGWKTESFTDPVEFLRHAETSRPPLVVLDIWMPKMNGLEVQKKLRRVSPSTKVIILTSKDDPSVRSQALEEGAAAFFLKPAADDEFLGRIESICRDLNGSRPTPASQHATISG